MKRYINILILFLLWISSSLVYAAEKYMILPIDYVVDGDTIATHVSEYRLPPPLNELYIRIDGIDTPEMPADSFFETGKLGKASCEKEAKLAIEAKVIVEQLAIGNSKMYVYYRKWDKFGGRILGRVTINGTDVGELLIREGLAVSYDGKTKTKDWCL